MNVFSENREVGWLSDEELDRIEEDLLNGERYHGPPESTSRRQPNRTVRRNPVPRKRWSSHRKAQQEGNPTISSEEANRILESFVLPSDQDEQPGR